MKLFSHAELPKRLELLNSELQQAPFTFVLLLGSAAEGKAFRDLDLAFWSEVAESELLELTLDWGERFERAAGVPVDLVPLPRASLGFQHQASKGRVLLCRNQEALAEWKERTWNQYFALQPHFRQHARDLLTG